MTLVCKVPILNGVEKWKNVTYRIEWFAEGKTLKSETSCGGLAPGGINDDPCPNVELKSLLPGNLYNIGQSVSFTKSLKEQYPCFTMILRGSKTHLDLT